jgi:hypothetical protein
MTRYLLALLAVGLGIYLLRRQQSEDSVSSAWLTEQERIDRRVEYHGQSLKWPINKIQNEAGEWNARRYRRRA